MKPLPKAITLTDRAAERVKEIMAKADRPIGQEIEVVAGEGAHDLTGVAAGVEDRH